MNTNKPNANHTSTDFSTYSDPALLKLKDTYTFQENRVNSAPQLLFAPTVVELNGDYSNSFEGGKILTPRTTTFEPLINPKNNPDGTVPISGESQVNTYNPGTQENPAIASLNGVAGGYVIVWESDGQDGSEKGIYGQRFSSSGEKNGSEFLVNSTTLSTQDDPHVTGLSNGGFVVTWSDNHDLNESDTSDYGVHAQMYDTNGVATGGEFTINTEVSGAQNESQIAALNSGGFVVIWTSVTKGSAGDGSSEGIFAQLYDAKGEVLGSEFQVNTEFSGPQNQGSVAGLKGGGFVVTWSDDRKLSETDDSGYGIHAQMYDAKGVSIGGELQINTEVSGDQKDSQVTALLDGGFVVAWTSEGQDGSGSGIFAQRYNASGIAVGAEFRVNENTGGDQVEASITALSNDGFVITWTDNDALDGSGDGVFGQQYDSNGNRVDGQFQINTETSSNQYQSDVTALPEGGFVVTWGSQTSGADEAGDVFQQVFGYPDVKPPIVPPIARPPVDLNTPPVAVDDAFITDEDSALNGNVLNSNGNGPDFDVDGDDLTVTAVNGQAVGTQITLTSGALLTLQADGSFDYDPNGQFEDLDDGQTELDNFTYTISDGNGGTDQATASITIEGITDVIPNTPPVAIDDAFITDEDSALNGNVLHNNGSGADFDVDGDDLTVTAVNGQAVGTQITLTSGALLTLQADGSFDYDPNGQFEDLDDGQTELDNFTYTISDGNGGTDQATASITIEGITDVIPNTPPVAIDDAFITDEDSALNGNVLHNNGSGADFDVDGDDLTVTAVNGQAVGTQITLTSGALLTLQADGSFDYDPNGQFEDLDDGQTELDNFTYTISDGNGGTDQATASITIEGITDVIPNTPPVAIDDAFITDEDSALNGNVLHNNGSGADFDVDGDDLTVTAVNGQAVGTQITLTSGALLTLQADGSFDYDPNGQFEDLEDGQTELDNFTYTISDGNGGTDQATASITIEGITDVIPNTPPVAIDDAFITDEDSALNGNVLHNNGSGADFDVDGDDLTVTAVNGQAVGTQITLTSGALLTLQADGSFDYDPNGQFEDLEDGQTELDNFTYTISDGNGGTDQATASITIEGITDVIPNTPPVAIDDAFITDEDSALNGNVLHNNGSGADFDVDGDDLTVTAVNGQAVGTQITLTSGALLTLQADGSFDYDPNGQFEDLDDGQTELDNFTYTISDGNGGTDQATASITIEGITDVIPNTPPVAIDDAFITDEDSALNGNVLHNNGSGADFDVDGDDLTITQVNGQPVVGSEITLDSGALLTLDADGTFDYDPNGQFEDLDAGQTMTDSFSYTISDGNGGIDSATVSITIEGISSIRIGDAPIRITLETLSAWEDAWSDDEIAISHKADFTDNAEIYSEVSFTRSNSDRLDGGDIFRGDIGVSGQTESTSSVNQEIDGTEALKFELAFEATELSFGLSRFYSDDDGKGFSEAGRVLLLDENDIIVQEVTFTADSSLGEQEITVDATAGFTQVIFNAGAEDQEFVFGGYTDSAGNFGTAPFEEEGTTHGSDYLLDYVEFSFDIVAPLQALGSSVENIDTDILPA